MSDHRLLAFYQQALGGVSAVEELALRDEFLRRLIAAGITIDVNGVFTGLPAPTTIGGLSLATLVAGDLLYATGASLLARLAKNASANTVLHGGTVPSWSAIVNADVDVAAAIARTKLDFGSGLVNADIAAAAAIAYAKLNLATSIVNADINAAAAIAYTKLNLALGIVNGDINASAAIARSKLDFGSGLVNADIAAAAAIVASKLNLSGVSQTVFAARTSAGIVAGVTTYYGTSYESTTETSVKFPVPIAGTIKNLYVQMDGAPGGSETWIFTIRKNAVDQTVTCTVSAAALTANNTANSFTVVAGDLLSVKLVTSAGAATRTATLSFQLVTT